MGFVGLNNNTFVNNYYNGGFASDGAGPGPNYGVVFNNAYVLNEYANDEGLLVPGPNSITFLSGSGTPGRMGHNYCPTYPDGVTFAGSAESVNFSGTASYIVYDNITLGSGTPIATTPLPATFPLFATGLGAMGLFGWRKKRKAAAVLAAA